MWNKVEDKLPEDDREVLVYVRDLETPHWSKNHLGAYIGGKWYLQGGTKSHYEYVSWMDIEKEQEFKTSEQWNNIFNKTTVLDPDGWNRSNFQYSWFEEMITEKQFTSRLINSTTVIIK